MRHEHAASRARPDDRPIRSAASGRTRSNCRGARPAQGVRESTLAAHGRATVATSSRPKRRAIPQSRICCERFRARMDGRPVARRRRGRPLAARSGAQYAPDVVHLNGYGARRPALAIAASGGRRTPACSRGGTR